MKLNDLRKKIDYKWKVQTVSKNKPSAQCVAYIDARDVMDLLDAVVEPQNWQSDYKDIGGRLCAGIGIRTTTTAPSISTDPQMKGIDYHDWVWKWDTGTSGDFETEKSEFSDSFKRAGVKWGIGRFLYDLEMKYVKTNKIGKGAYPVNNDGSRAWDVTKLINGGASSSPKKAVSTSKASTPVENGMQGKCSECGGSMEERSGVSKAGKDWHGLFCKANPKEHKPVWL